MYSIKKINYQVAADVWEGSPNSSIFNNPNFLKNFKNIVIFGVYKGDEILCYWPIYSSQKNKGDIPDFFYYFGPCWSKKISFLQEHSWLSLSKNVYETFLKKLTSDFKSFRFELHHTLLDVRIFDWWNFGKKNKRFSITPRYSAIIDDIDKKNEEQLLKNYRYVRRYELKKFKDYENELESCEISHNELCKLYFKIVNVKSVKDKNSIKQNFKIFQSLEKDNFTKVLAFKSKADNKIVCVLMMLFDNHSSHLIINVADKYWKNRGIITWATHKSIMYSKKLKMKRYDFNGANSPLRGDQKHSFGSNTKLFFNLYYKK